MSARVHVVVALGDVPAAAWPARLAALRALGIDGVDVELVWRRHAAAAGRADFTGPLDLGALLGAIADAGLAARVDVGPLRGHAALGLGAPDHVVADERTWARGPHGGPVWLPTVPRAVPLPSADSDAWRAAVEIWLSQVAEAVAAAPRRPTPLPIGAAPATSREARLRASAFAFDYHPDAVRAWQVQAGTGAAPPTAWPADDALAWLAFADGADARLRAFVDERLAVELGHRGVASAPLALAPAVEPAPLLLPQAPGADPTDAARAALRDPTAVVRVRLAADAAPTALAWLPRQRAELAAAPAGPVIAVIDTQADARVAAASSVLPAVPTALLAWAAGAAPADALISADARARHSRAWAAAIDAGLRAAAAPVARLPADASDADLSRYPVVVVPTVARVERDLWQRLCALAIARRTLVVVGDALPTHDELDRPLPAELTSGRRIGRMQPAALADAALLGRDLRALLASVTPT